MAFPSLHKNTIPRKMMEEVSYHHFSLFWLCSLLQQKYNIYGNEKAHISVSATQPIHVYAISAHSRLAVHLVIIVITSMSN